LKTKSDSTLFNVYCYRNGSLTFMVVRHFVPVHCQTITDNTHTIHLQWNCWQSARCSHNPRSLSVRI